MGKEAFDNYQTPQPLANAMTGFLHQLFPTKSLLIEPACGEGRFLRAARELWGPANSKLAYLGVDIVPSYTDLITTLGVPFLHADFLAAAPELAKNGWFGPQALVYGNPPYSDDQPQKFIEVVSQQPGAKGTHIAFLLRQGFLGGINRALHWKERKSLRIKRDIAGRPKFNPNDKHQDHSEYAVFIYEVGYAGHYLGWEDPLIWKEKHLAEKAKEAVPA